MADSRKVRGLAGLQAAFDEVRFGAARTLNLRQSLPSGAEAAARLEAWLRQHQVQRSEELLVITGRGNNSEAGIAVVREATLRVFQQLRRRGVVAGFSEHTPGSFVVTLAPVTSTTKAPERHGGPKLPPPPVEPPTLAALDEATRHRLRVLAERSLDALGVRERGPFVEDEMLRLFGVLAATTEQGPDRESRLREAIERAISQVD